MLKRTLALGLFLFVVFSFTMVSAARGKFPPFRNRQPCKVHDRCWLGGEYLYWSFQDTPGLIPLVVKGPLPSSKAVLGGNTIQNDWLSGGKVSFGYWFDNSCQLGGEVSYLFLPSGSQKKNIHSSGSSDSSILSVPYFDILSNTVRYTGVARPSFFQGTAKLSLTNSLHSSEANVIALLPCEYSLNLALVAGVRYWSFCENISFKTDSPNIPPHPADVYETVDHFQAANRFYGGQIGVKIDYVCGCFFAGVQLKTALGTMHHEAIIKGHLCTNDFNSFGPVEKFKGGYFTMPSNIRKHKTECYSMIPEASATIGFRIKERCKFSIGYSIMCANRVLRPAKLIHHKINPTQSVALSNTPNPVLVGEAKPKPSLKSSNFFAHGLNAGMVFYF